MSRRKNIHPYLPDELFDRFKKFVAAEGATESSVVEAALKEYLDQTTHKKLQLKHLNTIANSLEPLQRDLMIMVETVFAFVKLWMLHNPELPHNRKMSQTKAVAARVEKFKRYISKVISEERLATNDLVKQAVNLEGLLGEETGGDEAVA
jgi:hypothetical protein